MSDERLKVAVLGPLGTYTHEAAFETFGHNVSYDEQSSIADVFKVLSPEVPLGVIPQENSIFGSVIETYDLLRPFETAFVRGEITLKVEHCLLVKEGVKLHEITKVMSHEQALGQCRNFLADKLPAVATVKTKSTAAAAYALLNSMPNCAAICSSICATLFGGLEILHRGIQNEASNFTRFYIITPSRQMASLPILGTNCQMKAIFRISLPSTSSPDAPCNIVTCLTALSLCVIRLDRRPSAGGTPFHSLYFVEVHGHAAVQVLGESLEAWTIAVEKASLRVENLGGTSVIVGIW